MKGPRKIINDDFVSELGLDGIPDAEKLIAFLMGLGPNGVPNYQPLTDEILLGLGYSNKPESSRKPGPKKKEDTNKTADAEKLVFKHLQLLLASTGDYKRAIDEGLVILQQFHRSCLKGLYLSRNDVLSLRFSPAIESGITWLQQRASADLKAITKPIYQVGFEGKPLSGEAEFQKWKENPEAIPISRENWQKAHAEKLDAYLAGGRKHRPRRRSFMNLENHLRRCYFTVDRSVYVPVETLRPLYQWAWATPHGSLAFSNLPRPEQQMIRLWFSSLKDKHDVFPHEALIGKDLSDTDGDALIRKCLDRLKPRDPKEVEDRSRKMLNLIQNTLKGTG